MVTPCARCPPPLPPPHAGLSMLSTCRLKSTHAFLCDCLDTCCVGCHICMFFLCVVFVFHHSFLLGWMFEHDCLDTCCFGCVICKVFCVFCICTCSGQLGMFHMERCFRNTFIIIIIIIVLYCLFIGFSPHMCACTVYF